MKHSCLFPASDLIRAILFVFVAISPTSAAIDNSTFHPQDYILLNCGISGQAIDTDGRIWTGDTGSKYAPFNNTIASQALQSPSLPGPVPYLTARVSTSPFTYSFPLGAGRKFIRLYFYPQDYSGRAASDAFFSVTAGNYTFLSNFSAWQTAQALNLDYLVKEYSVNVSGGDVLDITFTPTTATRSNAYAFVNGIEIISIPDIFAAGNPTLVAGHAQISYSINPSWALETVYRLNVGGQAISPVQDSGLYRSWFDDSPYIYGSGFGVTFSKDPNVTITYPAAVPEYVAPAAVYSTARSMGPNAYINTNYNLTWILTVDAGFYYLIRLHFCEIQYPITKESQRVFYIYLSNQTAESYADVIRMSGGIGKAAFKDFVIITAGSGPTDLWVALHPNTITSSAYWDSILNGLEVFKLQNTSASLAGLNPAPNARVVVDPNKQQEGKSKSSKVSPIVGGVVVGGILLLLAVVCVAAIEICKRQTRKGKGADTSSGWQPVTSHSAGSGKTKDAGYPSAADTSSSFSSSTSELCSDSMGSVAPTHTAVFSYVMNPIGR